MPFPMRPASTSALRRIASPKVACAVAILFAGVSIPYPFAMDGLAGYRRQLLERFKLLRIGIQEIEKWTVIWISRRQQTQILSKTAFNALKRFFQRFDNFVSVCLTRRCFWSEYPRSHDFFHHYLSAYLAHRIIGCIEAGDLDR